MPTTGRHQGQSAKDQPLHAKGTALVLGSVVTNALIPSRAMS
ncbi:hypothetical protein RE6C_00760 [Rhodopirellula europaea 6C]|uniref:Uncharacterized protein n=1 Tax=Rhodopirellula europaea 6C TaxID=1263867 RepID=M2A8Y7_9BACT|nr:hypothetical protein RE6C_00760 [Rhodopirellula europaea 6C]